jgi:hypothetical protein
MSAAYAPGAAVKSSAHFTAMAIPNSRRNANERPIEQRTTFSL